LTRGLLADALRAGRPGKGQQQYQAAISNCALMNKSLVATLHAVDMRPWVYTVNDQATA
jgi:hypothetical protein